MNVGEIQLYNFLSRYQELEPDAGPMVLKLQKIVKEKISKESLPSLKRKYIDELIVEANKVGDRTFSDKVTKLAREVFAPSSSLSTSQAEETTELKIVARISQKK